MKSFFSSINIALMQSGIDAKKFLKSIKGIPSFFSDKKIFKQLNKDSAEFTITKMFPCLPDRYEDSGNLSQHYFYQDLLVANYIFKANPQKHVDIGSRVDGFVAHVASFRQIEILDIRPLTGKIPNVIFNQIDITKGDEKYNNYCDSLSCLHSVEHFGLGRYGDQIDPWGYKKGLENLYKILKPGGKFYFSVPIGPQRIEFNAHRVFSLTHLFSLFKDKYNLDDFSYIDDNGNLFDNHKLSEKDIETNLNCNYGCAIFILTKV